ncbi:MAG: L,D-transpeptidase family protein [Anaerolineae bacterium]|nr:L,D-transpeptidase family protein [Anaerolineae bacterium]
MSNNLATSATENLRLGIEAARAGRREAARKHLTRVLAYAPDNIPALLWLAYVAPEPAESIRWLAQVLTLEPHNKRAKAGLEWAMKRAGHPTGSRLSTEAIESDEAVQASHAETELPDDFIRAQFLQGDEAQKRARKAALAQRARRNIAPLTLVLLIIGVTVLFSSAIWYLITVPDETLAAWMSEPAQLPGLEPAPVEAKALFVETPLEQVAPMKAEPETAASPNFTSKADTIILENSKLAETLETDDPFTPLEENQLPPLDIPPVMLDGAAQTTPALDLLQLVGPAEEIMDGVRLFVPVDETLLAYQPAFPDEKWIEVDIANQRVTSWEGNVPVKAFESSTGLPDTPTVTGQFNIYWKLESTVMIGADYYLPEVPYTMYFYGGYALHGAYWHNNFGQPMSHGCVNLSIDNSKELFEWADPVVPLGETQVVSSFDNPGTLVVVH